MKNKSSLDKTKRYTTIRQTYFIGQRKYDKENTSEEIKY